MIIDRTGAAEPDLKTLIELIGETVAEESEKRPRGEVFLVAAEPNGDVILWALHEHEAVDVMRGAVDDEDLDRIAKALLVMRNKYRAVVLLTKRFGVAVFGITTFSQWGKRPEIVWS